MTVVTKTLALLGALALTLTACAQTNPAKPPPKPAAKPAAKPVAPDPVTILYGRAVITIQDALREMRDLRTHFKANVVGKPYGKFTAAPPGPNGVDITVGRFESTVAAEYGEKGQEESTLEKSLAQLETELAQWKVQKLDTKTFLSHIYGAVVEAVDGAYRLTKPYYEAKVVASETAHTMDVRRQTISRQIAAESVGKSRPEQQRLLQKMLVQIDVEKQSLWTDVTAQAFDLRKRVDRSRKRWGAELWRYIEYAEAKTATATDGHAFGKTQVRDALNRLFGSRPRPVDFSQNQNDGIYIDVSSSISMRESVEPPVPFDHFTNPSEPQLQVFRNATAYLSTELCLEPPVEQLRNYVEPPEPPAIIDTFMLPQVGAGGTPILGRITAALIDGSEAYNLFVYGPKLPTKRSQLRIQGPPRGILYEVIALFDDLKNATPDVKRLREIGLNILGRGLNSAQQQDYQNLPFAIVRAKLTPGVLPGRHEFKVNGAATGWFLDKGTGKAEISFVRDVQNDPESEIQPADKFEPVGQVYAGEIVRIQIKTLIPVDLKTIPVVLGRNGIWIDPDQEATIPATLAEGEPATYRTGPLVLVSDDDPLLDKKNAADRVPGACYVAANGGNSLQAKLEDDRLFAMEKPSASIKVVPEPPISLWHEALSRAAKCAGLHSQVMNWNTLPGKTAKDISNTILTRVVMRNPLNWFKDLANALGWSGLGGTNPSDGITYTNSVKLGDHAALLLLRDRFVMRMREVAAELDKVDTPEKQVAFLDAIGPNIREMPIGQIVAHGSAVVPQGKKHLVNTVENLGTYYAGPQTWAREEAQYPGWIKAAKVMGFEKYRKSVHDSLDKATNIPDADIEALLTLIGCRPRAAQESNARTIGNGFDEVAKELKDLLVKAVKLPGGTGYRWVPDQVARGSVMGLNAALEAVRAQRDYSAADTQVVLAAASIVPIAWPAGIVRTMMSVALAAISAVDFYENTFAEFKLREQEFAFALGASSVLGAERFYLADVQRTPTWSVALQVLGAGLGVVTTAPEVLSLMGKLTKQVAFPLARGLAQKVKQLGAAAYYKAFPQEQAALLLVNAANDLRAAERGVQAAGEVEKEVQAAVKAVADDIAKQPRPRSIRAPELEIVDPVHFAAPPAVKINTAPVPKATGPWQGPDGFILLEKRLDNGLTTNFVVFKEAGKKVVVKICKAPSDVSAYVMTGVKKALETVRNKKIKHLSIIGDVVVADERAILRQELLRNVTLEGQEMATCEDILRDMAVGVQKSKVARDMVSKLNVRNLARLVQRDTSLAKRWSDLEDAVVDFLRDLQKKGTPFEDFKLDNIFAERNAAKRLEVGVCDIDRIEPWGDISDSMKGLVSQLVEGEYGCLSMRGNRAFRGDPMALFSTMNEYQLLALEAKGIIVWNPQTRMFGDGVLSVKKLAAVYPELNQPFFIDFVERAASLKKSPEPSFWNRLFPNPIPAGLALAG